MEQQLGPVANGHMPPDPVHVVSPQTAGTGFAASVGMFLAFSGFWHRFSSSPTTILSSAEIPKCISLRESEFVFIITLLMRCRSWPYLFVSYPPARHGTHDECIHEASDPSCSDLFLAMLTRESMIKIDA
jgi:hypothetical protein